MTPDAFRYLCGHFATGVTIVTARDADGRPSGMTANSFTAVSLDPPLISVAVDHAATNYPVLRAATHFAVNILADDQEALSRRFAEELDDRFDGVAWQPSDEGDPLLDGALAHLACRKWAELPAGDHTIFVGCVEHGTARPDARPLVHFRGAYHDAGARR